jgi:hypothetical protein
METIKIVNGHFNNLLKVLNSYRNLKIGINLIYLNSLKFKENKLKYLPSQKDQLMFSGK